jgi:phage replication-related protein YjqB (UPF0714/DUF867 family)
MMSPYKSFEELKFEYKEGVDFNISVLDRGSSLVVMAPHGGGIEPGTAEIVRALAEEHHSCYIFDGIREHGNYELHITSTNFDEPLCLELIKDAQMILAVHGCSGKDERLYIGGLHTHFKKLLFHKLGSAGFNVQLAGSRHAGFHPGNICNRGSSGTGVQLELSLGLRRKMFKGLSRMGRAVITPVFDEFYSTVQAAINEHQSLTDYALDDYDLDECDKEVENGNQAVWS